MATSAPDRSGPDEFLSAFDGFAQAVRRARGAPARSAPAGGAPAQAGEQALTLSQYGLLQGLAGGGCARVRELAAEAGIAASTATRILDALERRGIVRRTPADEDRRGVTITLTPVGQEQLETQHEWVRGRQRAFYEGLPPGERAMAPDLLLRLADLIDDLAAGP